MASILKRTREDGTRSYLVQIRLKGHPTVTATFDKEKDAKTWAITTEASIKEGRYIKTAEAQKHTLEQLIDRYKEEILPTKPASIEAQGPQLTWWSQQLGAYHLQDITPARLAEAKATLAKTPTRQGKKRSNGSVNRYLAALSHVFTIAVKEWNWMDDNPMRKVTRTREPRGRVRFLSDDERGRLLEACARARRVPALHTIVVIAIYTGMRQGEIVGLRWADVDFDRERVVLQKTKNGERRQVPLAPPALEALRAWSRRPAAGERRGDGLVFPSRTKPTKPISFRKSWGNAVAEAQLEDFHFHDTRHTAASYLAMSGASLQEIAEILGHKTLAMVKRYAHLTDSHTAQVMKRMAAKFSVAGASGNGTERAESPEAPRILTAPMVPTATRKNAKPVRTRNARGRKPGAPVRPPAK